MLIVLVAAAWPFGQNLVERSTRRALNVPPAALIIDRH
jgi:hypothetical protein